LCDGCVSRGKVFGSCGQDETGAPVEGVLEGEFARSAGSGAGVDGEDDREVSGIPSWLAAIYSELWDGSLMKNNRSGSEEGWR
jgi:hypothetical protein